MDRETVSARIGQRCNTIITPIFCNSHKTVIQNIAYSIRLSYIGEVDLSPLMSKNLQNTGNLRPDFFAGIYFHELVHYFH